MNGIIIGFLVMTAVVTLIYAALSLVNFDLSRRMRGDGPGKTVVKLIATLGLSILLNDIFWAIVFMSPRLLPEMDQETRLKVLLGINFVLRILPGLVLYLLWKQLYRRTG